MERVSSPFGDREFDSITAHIRPIADVIAREFGEYILVNVPIFYEITLSLLAKLPTLISPEHPQVLHPLL